MSRLSFGLQTYAPEMTSFLRHTPELASYWRAIILFGRNSASYKFALAKALLGLAEEGKSTATLSELAVPYSRHLTDHLEREGRQCTAPSSKFLDACRAFGSGEIGKQELVDQILESGSQASARERLEAVTSELKEKAPGALKVLESGFFDATAVLALPGKYQRRLRTTNSLERLIQEIRRREKVIRIFPSRSSAWRLIGALLAETHEEWSTGRRYLKMDAFEEWRREHARPDPSQLDAESESEPTSHSMQPA